MSWTDGSNSASSPRCILGTLTHKDLLFRASGERRPVEIAISLGNGETGILQHAIDIAGEILSEPIMDRGQHAGLSRFAQAPVDREDSRVGVVDEVLANLERAAAIVHDRKYQTVGLARAQVSQIRLVDVERENAARREKLARSPECCAEIIVAQQQLQRIVATNNEIVGAA